MGLHIPAAGCALCIVVALALLGGVLARPQAADLLPHTHYPLTCRTASNCTAEG